MTQEERSKIYAKWQSIIETQEKSGLSQKKFCEQNQIVLSQFVYFNNRLKPKENKTPSAQNLFVPVTLNKTQNPEKSFELRVILPNGFQCYFPLQVDVVQLKRLMEVFLSC